MEERRGRSPGGHWLARLRLGDPAVWELLFRTWYAGAYRTAHLITGRRELAEEAVQEAFFRAFRAIGTLRDPDRLQAWFHAVVSRSAVDVLRREGAGRTTPLDPADLEGVAGDGACPPDHAWQPPGSPTPEEAALARLRAEAVANALTELPPEFRQVTVLFYYHQLSVAEIAELLGCPEGTVKSRLNRARARLARALAREGEAAGD